MLSTEFVFALAIAGIVTAISIPILGWRKATRKVGWLVPILTFPIVFLSAWAAGVWFGPIGPLFEGMYWLPILLIAVFYALFLAAIMGAGPMMSWGRSAFQQAIAEEDREESAKGAFALLVGVLAIMLVAVAIGHFL